jgi:Lrp/AsnC family transcriptional regulator, regulator for asnA, asnC and gidA
VTKNTIWKHYKKLQQTGIITGSTVQLDYAAFGYHAIATILLNVESTYREQVIEHLRKLPDVLFILQFNVVYNIRVIARLRNLSDLDHIKETIRRQNPVVDLKTFVWTDVKNNPYNLSIGACQKTTPEPTEAKAEFPRLAAKDLDETDRRLIEKLGADGRESFRKISKSMGVSTDTVVKRYEKLRRSGAVKVIAQINPSKIGYEAILNFSLAYMSQKETSAIVEDLAKIPDVVIIIKTSGDYDLQITAMVKDIKQEFALQEEIAKIPNITKVETSARKPPSEWPSPFQHISTF